MTDPTASGFVTIPKEEFARLEEDQRILNECKDDKAALQEGHRIISEEQQQRIKYWRGRFEELEGRIKIYETFTGGKISRHAKGFIP